MYRPIIPLLAVALSCPAFAQISARPPAQLGHPMPSNAANQTREASGPLSLQAALRLALQANPELRAAEHEVQAVEAATMQARALPNPTLEIGVEDTRRETRETTVQLSQPLELGGRRASRVSAAERAQDAARADLGVRRAAVQADVITAFMNTVAAQERLRLSQESQDVADRVTTAVSKRVQAGKASPVEETRARVAQSYVRLEVSKSQSELNNARLALASTWKNVSPQFQHAVGTASTLPELPRWEVLAAKFSSLPAVVRAHAEVARREALVAVEQSRRTPDCSGQVISDTTIGSFAAMVRS
jgi:outer membrane protein, heavy metal efflux system